MALTLGDNFSYQGAKPLDGRLTYNTVAEMKVVDDATMYNGCVAYCVEADKTYQWKSTNTVDETLGRWREFSSGGSSGTTDYTDLNNKPTINDIELDGNKTSEDLNLASKEDMTKAYKSDDTAFTDIADGDYIPVYDTSATAKKKSLWSNIKAKLKTYFDTIYDLNKADIPYYGQCTDNSSTTAKTVTVQRGTFSLVVGAKVSVRFTNINTASAPTLNVGSTGAKNIKYIDSNGTVTTPTTWWGAGDVVTFIYDGTQWIMQPTVALAQPNVAYGFTPVGTIISVMGNSAPTNYLACNGQTVNIADYPELANYFLAQFGSKNKFGGNGTTTFAVPDLRGEFLRGTGTNSHSNCGNGEAVGTHQTPTQHHQVLQYYNGSNQLEIGTASPSSSASFSDLYGDSIVSTDQYTGGVITATRRTSDPRTKFITSRPTNTSVLYCIAVKDIYMNPADTYSTSEQVVGKWIDGKPIYQKTVSGTFPSTTSGTYATNDIATISNVDKVISQRGFYLTGNSYVTLPWIAGSGYISKVTYEKNRNAVSLSTNNEAVAGITAYVTIQYTKTT